MKTTNGVSRVSPSLFLLLTTAGAALVWPATARAQQRVHHDVLVRFNDPQSIVTLAVSGLPADLRALNSSMSLSTPDVACTAPTCPFTLNYLAVAFQNFTQPASVNGNAATFAVSTPWIVIHGPLPVTSTGGQIVIPAGTATEVSAFLSGGTSDRQITPGFRTNTTPTVSPILIRLDAARQIASIDGTFNFTIPVQGVTLPGTARFMAGNVGAFDNLPPRANAGPDISLICPQVVTLDGSASTDPENNIASYAWNAGSVGRVSGVGPRAQLFFPAGAHPVTLTVTDVYDSSSTDTLLVTITNPAPTFTFVPPDVISDRCGALSIGTAQATWPCGPVAVRSNAPASFPYGTTIVTWTATAGDGQVVTATQRVVVVPGDDPACCPPGSRVIVGTSNNDVLNGTSGRDCILGLGAQDIINGLGGDDIISGGEGDDQIHAGTGNDVVSGGGGQDQLFLEDGADIAFGGSGDDLLDGGTGNDELHGGDGQDRLLCGAGDDRAFGDAGDDTLLGDDGNDFLDGGLNNNRCTGGAGVDVIMSCVAVDGVDQIPGGTGADNFDVCQCAPANKCVDCRSVVAACTATPGCRAIIRCVASIASCHQPNECAAVCENGFPQDAISQAALVTSCLGGC